MNLNGINPIIIYIIYPDGVVETINKDNHIYHMEYMSSLINRSTRLQEIIKRKRIYFPQDIDELKYLPIFDINKKLVEDGLVIINNLCIDDDDVESFFNQFIVYLPNELFSKQQEILQDIIKNNDMIDSWFAKYSDNKMEDITYSDFIDMLNHKTK